MGRVILRFHCLALRDEGDTRSVIHFEVEDDYGIAPSRAVIQERENGALDVSAPCTRASVVDGDAFAAIVREIYDEQVRLVAKLCGVMARPSCIMALGDRAFEMASPLAAANW